ncbi:hypothetical protein ACJ6WE_23015 [Streptomyces sp. MMS24-I31]|uniref:hypothetical protein n=1 Tax=Streptomyces sp. MMS24-I31 TaxID=3351563 RepID=UPI003896B96C
MTTAEQDEPYYVLYDGDFGISGLTGELMTLTPPVAAEAALGVVARRTASGDRHIGPDVRNLLASPLPEADVHTLWLAAVRGRFDPAEHGMDTRAWLGRMSELCPPPPPRPGPPAQHTKYLSTMPSHFFRTAVPDEEKMRRSVLGEIRAIAPELTRRVPLPGLVPALERAVHHAGAELGLRLLLRALKAYRVRVGKEQYDRFLDLGEKLDHHTAVAHDGLDVAWPPIDPARRDATWDFGLSGLSARFTHWYDHTLPEVLSTTAAGDEAHQTPGSAAAVLLDDTLRLRDSPLSTDTITTLWLAASDGGLSPDRLGIDGRQWLGRIAGACRERLREVAPDHRPHTRPARPCLAGEVLREVRHVASAMADRTVRLHPRGIPGSAVARALEQVVSQVDPDLGFRLFLRTLHVLALPLDREQYDRCQTLGDHFGYGEFHVSDVEFLVSSQ